MREVSWDTAIDRTSRPGEGERAVEIWRAALDATHDFLSPQDRQAIDEMVCSFLPQVPLWLAVDDSGYPLAFMLIDNGHMQALFVDPAGRGTGIGAALARHGLALYPNITTDVNEQNAQAVGFYEKMGSSARADRHSTRSFRAMAATTRSWSCGGSSSGHW